MSSHSSNSTSSSLNNSSRRRACLVAGEDGWEEAEEEVEWAEEWECRSWLVVPVYLEARCS